MKTLRLKLFELKVTERVIGTVTPAMTGHHKLPS